MGITAWLELLKEKRGKLQGTIAKCTCVPYFYREVVKVILKSEDTDTEAVMHLMKVYLEKKKTIFGYTYEIPLRMLIKTMPGSTSA